MKHFVSKLSDADAEAAETQCWLDFALDCDYLKRSDYEQLNEQYEIIIGGLVKMMTSPERWCSPSSKIHEEETDYLVGKNPHPPIHPDTHTQP